MVVQIGGKMIKTMIAVRFKVLGKVDPWLDFPLTDHNELEINLFKKHHSDVHIAQFKRENGDECIIPYREICYILIKKIK